MHDRPSAGIEVEVQSRQAAELKSQEAEHLAAELASALNVMTSHCEELERQAEAAAAQVQKSDTVGNARSNAATRLSNAAANPQISPTIFLRR